MPGRQSHGRPVTAKPTGRKSQKTASKSRAKTHSNALNAFALAKEQVPEVRKGRLYRELEPEPDLQSKRRRGNNDEDEDDGEEEDDDAGPRRQKRQKLRDNGDDAAESDFGSDSDGNEWHVGVDGDDDDSDIDSDEAFGESDEERFEGYAFGGSSAKDRPKKRGGLSEDEDDEEDDDSLGEDAIDLATALDQYNSDSEDDAPDDKSDLGSDSGSEEDDESSASESPDTDDDDDDSLGDEEDSSKLDALRDLASAFASSGKDDEADDTTAPSRMKIDLDDLGLSGVKDANIKKSLKLLRKEEKANKPGASKKLDVPLAKRQQDRLMRVAALEKTTKTLDKWQDTVKHNRRADHLVFPLPQDLPSAGLDNSELLPLRKEALGSELEQTIMSIMEESGLGPSAKRDAQQVPTVNDDGETLTREQVKEIWSQRRRERELKSREQERAKRIKKIKSKSYRRVHRKEKARDAAKQGSDVEVDSEEEREAHDRRRALERVGAKHRESKWAKMAKNTGRAAWDDDFREGLTDMARREQELRRRVEGRTRENGAEKADSDESSEESGNEEDEKTRLRRKLEKLAADEEEEDDDGPRSALMKMPFMKRAEAAQKKANDEAIAQIARELGSDYDEDDDEPQETMEVGRRTYGMGKDTAVAAVDMDGTESSEDEDGFRRVKTSKQKKTAAAARAGTTGKTKLSKQQISAFTEAMDLSTATADVTLAPKKLLSEPSAVLDDETSASDSEVEVTTRRTPAVVTTTLSASRPRASRPQLDQIDAAKAFGGADVEAEFLTEKVAVVQEDDDKIVDDSMPGWGSWGGAGVRPLTQKQAAAAAHRRAKYNLSVVPGAKKAADRKDAKLDRVIINEKRIRKNDKYLASQLPHQFESREQYERSLRLPLGPEWSTKGTFQDATKPRILLKQGIIAPMSRPKF